MVWCLTILCVSADRRHNECVGQDQTQSVCVGIEPFARACRQQLIECARSLAPVLLAALERWPRSRLKGSSQSSLPNQSNQSNIKSIRRSSISAPSSPGFKPDSHDDPPRARAAGGRRWAHEATQNGVLGRPQDRRVSAPSCRPPLSDRPTLSTFPYSNFRPGLMSSGGLVPSQLPPVESRPRRFPSASCPVVRPSLLP